MDLPQRSGYDCRLLVALRRLGNSSVIVGHLTTPTVSYSDLPLLLDLTALRKNRAILDFNTFQLHFCGPGDYNLVAGLPPGTDSFQCELAPSGHLVVPCCEYDARASQDEHTLTLIAQPSQREAKPPPPPSAPPRVASVPAASMIVEPPRYHAS